ncbi:hypothetical protein ACIQB5_47980, partial [Streptomyces sp. NPDC088560]
MSATQVAVGAGTRLLDQLIAVHGVMTCGAGLVAHSCTRLAGGSAADTKTLVSTVRWLVDFLRHHRLSEEELLWPVPRERFPERVRRLDRLTEQKGPAEKQVVASLVARRCCDMGMLEGVEAALAAKFEVL